MYFDTDYNGDTWESRAEEERVEREEDARRARRAPLAAFNGWVKSQEVAR